MTLKKLANLLNKHFGDKGLEASAKSVKKVEQLTILLDDYSLTVNEYGKVLESGAIETEGVEAEEPELEEEDEESDDEEE